MAEGVGTTGSGMADKGSQSEVQHSPQNGEEDPRAWPRVWLGLKEHDICIFKCIRNEVHFLMVCRGRVLRWETLELWSPADLDPSAGGTAEES